MNDETWGWGKMLVIGLGQSALFVGGVWLFFWIVFGWLGR